MIYYAFEWDMLVIQQLGPNFVLVFNFHRLWQGLRDVHVNTDPGVGQKYSLFGDSSIYLRIFDSLGQIPMNLYIIA